MELDSGALSKSQCNNEDSGLELWDSVWDSSSLFVTYMTTTGHIAWKRRHLVNDKDPTYAAVEVLATWAQYGIDLPGSLHTNKIPVILGRYPLPRFFCRLNIVPLDMDNGTFNSSHTDVVEKVNFLVAASQHGGTSVAEGSP